MILKQLELKNFRRFRELSLEFSENLHGLVGPNGAGKSTVIEALAWAFYGTRAVRGAKTEVRSHHALNSEICEARVVFEVSGKEYRIHRALKGKNAASEAALFDFSETKLADGENKVNEATERLVGLDYRSFFASVFARQKDLSAIADMRPEERKAAINRLINIDAIDLARRKALELRTAAKNDLNSLPNITGDVSRIENNIKKFSESTEQEEKAVAVAKKSFDAAFAELEKNNGLFETISRTRDRFLQLQAEQRKDEAESENVSQELKQTLAELTKIKKSEQQLDSLEAHRTRYFEIVEEKEKIERSRLQAERLSKSKEELTYQNGQIAAEQEILLRLQREITRGPNPEFAFDNILARKKTLRQEENRLQEEQREILKKLGAVKSRGQEARQLKTSIEETGAEGECPVCRRTLIDHFDEVVGHYENRIDSLLAEYRELQAKEQDVLIKLENNRHARDELEKEREDTAEAVAVVRQKRLELEQCQKRREQHVKKRSEIQEEITLIGEVTFDPEAYRQTLREFDEHKRIQDHAAQIAAQVERKAEMQRREAVLTDRLDVLQKTLNERTNELAELGYDSDEFTQARESYERSQKRVNQVRETLLEAEKALVASRTQLENAHQELLRIEAHRKKAKELEATRKFYEELAQHFGRFRIELAGRLRPLIEAEASRLLRLTTRNRYQALELDEAYNILLSEHGEAFPLRRFSGGEQDLANLCLRIAISRVVGERSGKPPIRFIVLDEIFGSQDRQRQALIMQALQTLQSQFRQIFIISHIESIKESLPILIDVSMTSMFESRATMI